VQGFVACPVSLAARLMLVTSLARLQRSLLPRAEIPDKRAQRLQQQGLVHTSLFVVPLLHNVVEITHLCMDS